MKKIISLIMVLSLGIFGITACSTGEESTNTEDKKLNIIYANWAEGVAMTHLAEVILEEEMDYEVETNMADVGVIFASLAEGDADLFLDAWLPLTQKNYMEEYGDNIDDLGTNFEGAKLGIGVPKYMEDVNTIADLEKYADEFNGQIVGIDSGAAMMGTTEEVMDVYGLDSYELISGSEPAMTASLKAAVDKEEPIAFLAWQPHWKFSRWDLKFLEDPELMYGEEENIYSLSRQGLEDENPEVVEFVKNFEFTESEISSLMDMFENESDEREAAKKWIEENRELVDSWIPQS